MVVIFGILLQEVWYESNLNQKHFTKKIYQPPVSDILPGGNRLDVACIQSRLSAQDIVPTTTRIFLLVFFNSSVNFQIILTVSSSSSTPNEKTFWLVESKISAPMPERNF